MKDEKYVSLEALVGSIIFTPSQIRELKNKGIDLIKVYNSVQPIKKYRI